MGDGIRKAHALIINGDDTPESREKHLQNVDRAIQALRAEGDVRISVASVREPKWPVDQYLFANSAGIQTLIQTLSQEVDEEDQVVVYVTGHGGQGEKGECAVLPDGCYPYEDLSEALKRLLLGNRFVYLDACQAGGSIVKFMDDKTRIFTLGSKDENVSCQSVSPHFWSLDPAIDKNGDGVKTLQERYAYAVKKGNIDTEAQYFNPGPELSLLGSEAKRSPFSLDRLKELKLLPENSLSPVVVVHSGDELRKVLGTLEPGQLSLVTFSADWCGPCHAYRPYFEQLANQYDGRFLMIVAEGVNGSEEDWRKFGNVTGFPTVAFLDHRGFFTPVEDRMRPLDFLKEVAIHDDGEKIALYIKALRNPDRKIWEEAAWKLGQMGEKAKEALPELKRLLQESPISSDLIQAIVLIGGREAIAKEVVERFSAEIYLRVMTERMKWGLPTDPLVAEFFVARTLLIAGLLHTSPSFPDFLKMLKDQITMPSALAFLSLYRPHDAEEVEIVAEELVRLMDYRSSSFIRETASFLYWKLPSRVGPSQNSWVLRFGASLFFAEEGLHSAGLETELSLKPFYLVASFFKGPQLSLHLSMGISAHFNKYFRGRFLELGLIHFFGEEETGVKGTHLLYYPFGVDLTLVRYEDLHIYLGAKAGFIPTMERFYPIVGTTYSVDF